ncbi:MAG: AAA family ATPase [Candidatus Saccharibacteria bacterium]|nr:AAA family ATPase [Candidatus Saccharibacteria bacterium]
MKLNKIQYINFASFKDFECSKDTKEFRNINIILGWNGSGKTTLSKVLRSLELELPEEGMSFQLKIDSRRYTESNMPPNSTSKIRVFNNDYVKKVLASNSAIPYVFYIGEEGVDYAEKEQELQSKQDNLDGLKCDADNHDRIATDTAGRIRDVAGINIIPRPLSDGKYGDYDKRDFIYRIKFFENEFEKEGSKMLPAQYIEKTYLLTEDEVKNFRKQINNSEQFNKVEQKTKEIIGWIKDNEEPLNSLLQKTPERRSSQRIEDMDAAEQEWVQLGVGIHFPDNDNDPRTKCLFCASDIKNEEELRLHFSKEVLELSGRLEGFEKQIAEHQQTLNNLSVIDADQKTTIKTLNDHLDSVLEKVKEKSEQIPAALDPLEPFNPKHLTKTNIPETRTANREQFWAQKIECHYVAKVVGKYLDEKQQYEKCEEERGELSQEIEKLNEEVAELRLKAQNKHEAAQKLSDTFKAIFPYGQITIQDNDENTGYKLTRGGVPCDLSSLSEGEHNLLALMYFLIALNDENRKLDDNALIVIDDPISSLDKNSIYQIFSLIVDEIEKNKDSRQYILMTHSLDFLGHLLEHYRKKINEQEEEKQTVCLYNVSLSSEGSEITNMNSLLQKYKSDYYYLFDILRRKLKGCPPEENYLIANLLRRWLETFLNFKFSSDGNFQGLLSKAHKTSGLDQDSNYQITALRRFLDSGSHGLPDTETSNNSLFEDDVTSMIKMAFKLVEKTDKDHFSKLKKVLGET